MLKFQLELQSVVLTVGIVYEDVVDSHTILANLYHLEAEALLHESVLVVDTEHHGLAMTQIDGILGTSLLVVHAVVGAIVEDDAVLQYLAHRSTLMSVGSLEYLYGARSIGRYGTGKEVTAGTEAELGRAEGILDRTIGA